MNREDVSGSDSPKSLSNSVAKPGRYKKVLPVDWIDSNTDTRRSDAPILRPQVNRELVEFEYLDMPNDERGKRYTRNTLGVDSSIPTEGNDRYTPPPEQRFPSAEMGQEDWFLPHSPSRRVSQTRRGSTERYHLDWPKAQQSPSQAHGAAHEQPHHHDATISPPISVGQLSSVLTTSPFHGRDLPVKGPTISPSYSVV